VNGDVGQPGIDQGLLQVAEIGIARAADVEWNIFVYLTALAARLAACATLRPTFKSARCLTRTFRSEAGIGCLIRMSSRLICSIFRAAWSGSGGFDNPFRRHFAPQG